MDDLPETPTRRGRGARANPANQYEPLHVDLDPDALDEEELRQVETKYFRDPAQSILSTNESPDVPFRYSINPYRGCEHGCVYCLHGETLILMGDGRTKPLRDVVVGDEIYGTERQGCYRRYVRTRVLDHWSTEKPAYRITLGDGTQLIASADHRFLTDRGWKFVTGEEQGRDRRPHLTTNTKLLGIGDLTEMPQATPSDLALRRKSDIEGQALKSTVDLGIESIDPMDQQMRLFDITTGTGDFIANGVVSHNCYARPTHEYLGFSAGLDFETRILVKENAPELLEETFQTESWSPAPICLSGNTDSYQPAERELEVTRELLKVCAYHRNPVMLITKNGMVTRDLDILEEMAEWNGVRLTVSVTTLDDELAGAMEPRAARPPLRLRTIEECAAAGVPVGVNAAPIVPGLTDEEVPRILEAAAERGATTAGYTVLRLPGAVREVFVDWLDRHVPDRKNRVLNRLRSLRGEELNDEDFGKRMTGEGLWADTIGDLFRLARSKHGLDGPSPPLNTDAFRRRPGGQIGLFESSG
jgi:DNA repair photolyase